MKNLKKKGFTIVELVIVIAVIAVLAAVLIPTFVNLTRKANQSADIQATRQMNVVLASDKYATIEEAVAALAEAGYNALDTLTPVSTGYSFWWVEEYNSIVLLNEKAEVVFASNNDAKENFAAAKEAGKAFNLKRGLPEVEAGESESVVDALRNGQSVVLSQSLEISEKALIKTGEDVVIDLNGHTLTTTATNSGTSIRHETIEVSKGATLVIENGIFEGRSVMNYGTLTIKSGTTIKALDYSGGGCIRNKAGGKVVIEGGTFEAVNHMGWNEVASYYGGAAVVHNDGGEVIINGGTFVSATDAYLITNNAGTMTINGGTFKAHRGILSCNAGTVTINNNPSMSIEVVNNADCEYAGKAYIFYAENGNIIVNGGTFTGGLNTYCVKGEGTGSITLKDGTKLTAGQQQ